MLVGECNGEEVAFKISAKVSELFTCHCFICRKSTGSNGIPVVMVKNESFTWQKGLSNITTWRKPVGERETSFCKKLRLNFTSSYEIPA